MEPIKRIMRRNTYNLCSHCRKVIQRGEPYYVMNRAPITRKLCMRCYPSLAYVDWDDSEEESGEEPFGMTFYQVDPRTGKTIDVFT